MAFTPAKKGPDYARLHSTLVNSKTQVQGPINNNALFQTISGLINGVKTFQDLVNASFGTVEGFLELFGAEFKRRNSEDFGVSVKNIANQVANDLTEVILEFDTTIFDTGGIFDGTSKFIAPADAQYLVTGQASFSGTGGNSRFLIFRQNGTTDLINTIQRGTTDGRHPMSGLIFLNEGDYLQFVVMQNAGVPCNTWGAFQMFRVSY